MPATVAKGYELQATGSNSGTWGDVNNADVIQIIDNNMGGIVTKGLTNVNVTLTTDEAQNAMVRLTGTLTGAVQITSACIGFYYVENLTSGAFAVTLTNGVGSPITIPQNCRAPVIADSTNGVRFAQYGFVSGLVIGTSDLANSAVTTAKIADSNVTYAKIQNVTAKRLIGNSTAGATAPEEVAVNSTLTLSSQTLGVTIPSPMAFISTTTVSNASALNIASGIDTTYDEYEIHLDVYPSTASSGFLLQVSSNSGASYATSSYESAVFGSSSTGVSGADASSSGVALVFASSPNGILVNGTYRWRGVVRIWPNDTSAYHNVSFIGGYRGAANGFWSVTGSGIYSGATTAINAIRFVMTASNITGSARLYGIKYS